MKLLLTIITSICILGFHPVQAETWRGLTVAPENRCSPYVRSRDYTYPQSIEKKIVNENLGGRIYSPYTNEEFTSLRETDIEHIVATSEAHDSGLCSRNQSVRKQFSRDLMNLTLASPALNRWQKGGKDAADWQPLYNKCWFVDKVINVKKAYNLTIDRRERDALKRTLNNHCKVTIPKPISPEQNNLQNSSNYNMCQENALACYDDNGNGRITCKEARNHKITPVYRTHPAYQYMRDADGNGVVCE